MSPSLEERTGGVKKCDTSHIVIITWYVTKGKRAKKILKNVTSFMKHPYRELSVS